MLNNERLSSFPLRSSQGWLLSPPVIRITLENPAGAIRQGKEIRYRLKMKKNKIMCSPDNMTFYVENPKESTEKSIDPTKKHYNKGF